MGTDITEYVPDLEGQKEVATTHVEDIKDDRPQITYDEADAGAHRTGLRRLLRRNPSLEFMRDVARENELELDALEVKKVRSRHPHRLTCRSRGKYIFLSFQHLLYVTCST